MDGQAAVSWTGVGEGLSIPRAHSCDQLPLSHLFARRNVDIPLEHLFVKPFPSNIDEIILHNHLVVSDNLSIVFNEDLFSINPYSGIPVPRGEDFPF